MNRECRHLQRVAGLMVFSHLTQVGPVYQSPIRAVGADRRWWRRSCQRYRGKGARQVSPGQPARATYEISRRSCRAWLMLCARGGKRRQSLPLLIDETEWMGRRAVTSPARLLHTALYLHDYRSVASCGRTSVVTSDSPYRMRSECAPTARGGSLHRGRAATRQTSKVSCQIQRACHRDRGS